jgi:hypothetical protein
MIELVGVDVAGASSPPPQAASNIDKTAAERTLGANGRLFIINFLD